MSVNICCTKAFFGHPDVLKFNAMLHELFEYSEPGRITEKLSIFLQSYPLPIESFPLIEGRSILSKSANGFEAMAARWSKGAISSIHGHPHFTFYFVVDGRLRIDNFKRSDNFVKKATSETLSSGEYFFFTGRIGTFDNNIHQVQAIEETLSIHISSDDSTKGEIFRRYQ